MHNINQKKFIESLTDGGMIDSIFGYAYNRCFSEYEAEDLCQEIITEILLALQNDADNNSNNIENLNAYIWQIAHNTYIDHANRQKRAKANCIPLDPAADINVNYYSADPEDDILERIVDADNLSRIKREISVLPEIYRNAMILYYFDGLSVAEIARALGIPENRVRQRLFAAREKIKKEVIDMSEQDGKSAKQPKKINKGNQKISQQDGLRVLDTMVRMLEYRCEQTGEDPEYAAMYVKILIDAMLEKGVYIDEIKNWDVDSVVSASRIHDIGKIALPDNILMKPGKLTPEEIEVIRSHIPKGEEILCKVISQYGETPIFKHARLFIRSHHERWDGEGFPNGLKGEEIPLQGRIMKIADVYETLVSQRPYKAALTYREAEDIIKNNAGIHFDPLIVDVFNSEEIKKAFEETAMQFKKFL